jgi:hypothetical protein
MLGAEEMIFIETPIFTKKVTEYLSDLKYSFLQSILVQNPEEGDVIKKSGGIRKIRCGYKNIGKRGGLRVIYYCISNEELLMLYVYKKSDTDDLTQEQIKALEKIVKEEYK